MTPSSRILAYLFGAGEPVEKQKLFTKLGIPAEQAVLDEAALLANAAGLALIDDGRELELRTGPGAAEIMDEMRREEFSRDIGKAGLETLSILLYKGPASRAQIDYLRGVNSNYILRSLYMRGLVRRVANPKDERSLLYEATTELLAHLGVSTSEQLPEIESIRTRLKALEVQKVADASVESTGEEFSHETNS